MFSSVLARPEALALLVIVAVLAVAGLVAQRRRRRRLGAWGASSFALQRGRFRFLCLALLLFGLGLVIAGIAGPRWGFGEVPEVAEGRDLVCVLDVSRSMLAEDASISRL